MKIFTILLFVCIGCFKINAECQRDLCDNEKHIISMTKLLFDKITDDNGLCKADEEYFFGPQGGILGEYLYSHLKSCCSEKDVGKFLKNPRSAIGILLQQKLYEILKDKKRFSFALSSKVITIDPKHVQRTGVNASFILFVRAIPLTEDKYFNDLANGVNFIFAINYKSNKKDAFYIDLVNSYINGIPFYKFLGFYGNYASGLKLPENEIKKIFMQLNR